MAQSHIQQVSNSSWYSLNLTSSKTIATIAAARIWRNIGLKAALGYAAKRGLNMALVRLACQLEATRKAGL